MVGLGRNEEWWLMGREASGGDVNILKFIIVMLHKSNSTKSHQIVHFKWVNYMVCALYLNKTVIKKE